MTDHRTTTGPAADGRDSFEAPARARDESSGVEETCGDQPRGELDLDEVVLCLRTLGVDAVVEQTGGGCATIHAGPQRPHPFESDTVAFAAVAGPGRYGWGRQPSVADLAEFCVGPDDCGVCGVTEAWPAGARDPAAVAKLIAEQITHPERPASADELAAAGFDRAAAETA